MEQVSVSYGCGVHLQYRLYSLYFWTTLLDAMVWNSNSSAKYQQRIPESDAEAMLELLCFGNTAPYPNQPKMHMIIKTATLSSQSNQSINFYIRVPSLARLIGWHHEIKTQSTYVQNVDEESNEAKEHEHICGGGHNQRRDATPTPENPAQHRCQI